MSTAVTEEARKKANLRLLQRTCDASITDILATATHVVLYEFSQSSWSKSDVEGPLFVVTTQKSLSEMSYLLIILNKSSNDNFCMPITSQLHLQHQDPYLICKRTAIGGGGAGASASVIQGIWFHHSHEQIALTQVLDQLVQSLEFQASILTQQQQQQQTPFIQSEPPPKTAVRSTSASLVQPLPRHSEPVQMVLAAAHSTPPAVVVTTTNTQPIPPPSQSTHGMNITRATDDERAQLANLLSQTALAAAAVASTASMSSTSSSRATVTPPMSTMTMAPPSRPTAAPPNAVFMAPLQPPPDNMVTASAATTEATTTPSLPAQGVALDKKSLQLALLSLIQDDRFIDLLHSQYLRVIKAKTRAKHRQQHDD